jgi:DNA modification methylase
MKPTIWQHCYDDGWQGFITKESFAHPAKYARGLIERIYDHMLSRGWIRKGDVVGDCFGGIATGGIVAAYRGLHWIGVELEPRFVGFAQANIALHKAKLEAFDRPLPTIIQGDSRKFAEIVAQAAGVVTSPPFLATEGGCKPKMGGVIDGSMMQRHNASADVRYGDESAQIGNLKAGNIDAVVSSPPYNLPMSQDHNGTRGGQRGTTQAEDGAFAKYGNAPGQIEGIKQGDVSAVITSPPYSDIAAGAGGLNTKPATKPGQQSGRNASAASQDTDQKYGHTEGQIGQESKETYWQAMRDVYAQCFLAIKPGGYLAVVVKDYVKDKQIVPLCDDTVKLLEHLGFQLVERVHAMLVKETRHGDLFNGETATTKQRKSFFRRLAEAKGSPKIDYEEVIFCRKP